VGGFAIGLASATWAGPFKALAKCDACLGVYHSSGALLRGREAITSGQSLSGSAGGAAALPTYGAGDAVGVLLRPNGDVAFYKNGSEVGVIPGERGSSGSKNSSSGSNSRSNTSGGCSSKAKGALVLACQPYMGGVARIVRAQHGPPAPSTKKR
jgi:hypothetical protein